MKYNVMQHFIFAFTVCQSTSLNVFSLLKVSGNLQIYPIETHFNAFASKTDPDQTVHKVAI